MADSLLFASGDRVTTALGGAGFAFGPGTIAAIVKLTIDSGSHVSPVSVGASDPARYGLYRNPSDLIDSVLDTSEATAAVTISTSQNWQVLALTKATGSVAPRAHRYIYDTDTWTHVDSGTSQANSSVPITRCQLGAGTSASSWEGNVLIAGVWNTVLSDGTIETLKTGLQQWVTANPVEGWRLDTMSSIAAFGSNGTADESARTGTSLDTGDVPSGWSDTLGGGLTPPYLTTTIS